MQDLESGESLKEKEKEKEGVRESLKLQRIHCLAGRACFIMINLIRPYDDRLKDCASFLTLWMFSFGSRTQFHGLLIFCRLNPRFVYT